MHQTASGPREQLLDEPEFETFSVYKFSMNYPPICRVEFNPKTRREAGDIVFHFPDPDRPRAPTEKVFLSWGALDKATKKFPTRRRTSRTQPKGSEEEQRRQGIRESSTGYN